MTNKSLKELQNEVNKLCKNKGWDKLSISDKFLLLSEEVGELAKAIRKHTNLIKEKEKDSKKQLEEEFGDVLSYLLDLANKLNIDMDKALKDNLEKHDL